MNPGTQPPVKSEDELEKRVKALLVFHLGVHEDTSLIPEVRDWVQLIKQEAELHADAQWWVTTGLKQGGKKLLGPFATKDLALSVRTYMEMAEAPATYWVELEEEPRDE